MDSREIRLRLIEAAARNPVPHRDGYVAGVLEAAATWEKYVQGPQSGQSERTLTLPKKGVKDQA
jgi:hypothetical protein